MYAADFNAPGLDPTLARERSFFETFAMASPPEYGVRQGNVLFSRKVAALHKADRRTAISASAVCTENLNTDVVVMKSAMALDLPFPKNPSAGI